MTIQRPFLSVQATLGEQYRRKLLELNLLDLSYKLVSENERLFLPLTEEMVREKLAEMLDSDDFELGIREFPFIVSGPRTVHEALVGKLSVEEIESLPRAYDLVGDIAVLEIPEELNKHGRLIGETFQSIHTNFSTVLGKKGAIKGTTRTRQYEFLAGEDKTETIHIEYGCRLAVDLAKAYFSPRLLEEHNQVAQKVNDGELIVDLFTGVGPFAIHAAKNKDVRIIAVDINPEAIKLLQKSITLNKLVGQIEPTVSDAHEYSKISDNQIADRVIMNHPSGAFNYVRDACKILRIGGIMHYYDFVGGDNPEQFLENKITGLVTASGRRIGDIERIRRVRDSAPYEFQMVADVIIQ
ncbi:MAG: class I SAM-dependent methyltransferase [Candidatus Thorarchaeota archaeon]